MANKNQWLLAVFVVYLLGILVFGAVYYLMYKQERANFAFNSDILRSQKDVTARSTREQLARSNEDAALIREFRAVIGDSTQIAKGSFAPGSATNPTAAFDCPAGRYTYIGAAPVPGSLASRSQLRIEGRNGSIKKASGGPFALPPRTLKHLDEVCVNWQDQLRVRDEELRRMQASIEGDTPDVWTFMDFVYFSSITQCTVGYGDILPNSTPVRLLVTLQTLFSAALLVVVINLTIQSRQAPGSGSSTTSSPGIGP